MTNRVITWLLGTGAARDAEVHFHTGPQSQPAACDNPRCEAPRLDV